MKPNRSIENLSAADFEFLDSLWIVFEDKSNLNYYSNTKPFDIEKNRKISVIKKRNFKYNLLSIMSLLLCLCILFNKNYRLEITILQILLISGLLLFSFKHKKYDCKMVIFLKGHFREVKIKNKEINIVETIINKLSI